MASSKCHVDVADDGIEEDSTDIQQFWGTSNVEPNGYCKPSPYVKDYSDESGYHSKSDRSESEMETEVAVRHFYDVIAPFYAKNVALLILLISSLKQSINALIEVLSQDRKTTYTSARNSERASISSNYEVQIQTILKSKKHAFLIDFFKLHIDASILKAIERGINFKLDDQLIVFRLIITVVPNEATTMTHPTKHRALPVYQTVALDLTRIIPNRSTDLCKKLRLDYKLNNIQTKQVGHCSFICEFSLSSKNKLCRLLEDIESEHLSKLIKGYSRLADSDDTWKLEATDNDGNNDWENIQMDNGVETDSINTTSTSSPALPPVTSTLSSATATKKQELQFLKKLLHNMITDKKFTPFDFLKVLRNNKNKCFRSSSELRVDSDVPLLHACLEHARYPFISIIFHMGWITLMSREKVPQTSDSPLRGKTAQEVADSKKARKASEEFKLYSSWEESMSTMMKATRSGDMKKVLALLPNEGERLHYRDDNNGNVLYWAVINGDLELFELLRGKGGVDPSMRTRKGENLLQVAAAMGQYQLIDVLYKKCELDPWHEDSNKKTALDKVAENGDTETLKAFIECEIQPRPGFLSLAAYHGRKRLIEYCIKDLGMSNNTCDMYKRTPLLRSIEAGRENIVDYLLSNDADLSSVTCNGRNVLHCAAESGDLSIATKVIKELKRKNILSTVISGQDRFTGVECCFLIRGRDKGRDAWHYVEVKRHIVALFMKRTKSGNVDVATFGKVLISGWGTNPEQETIDYVENEFKTRRQDAEQPLDQTPIHMAIFKGHAEVARLLLENGSDILIKDQFGLNPLMAAAAKNMTELVKDLESMGVDIKDTNKDGLTALQIAEENLHESVVNYINGRSYSDHIDTFLKSNVERLIRELSRDNLDRVRNDGRDVKRHLIDTLREFRIDINQTLVEIGSGPILEESQS